MKDSNFFSDTSPVYIQLYERLKEEIIRGVFPFGSRFPSKRVLADRYGISLVTVEHTIELLLDEGYLVARERSGYFVSFRESDIFTGALPEKTAEGKRPGRAYPSRGTDNAQGRPAGETGKLPEEHGAEPDTVGSHGDFPFSQYARIMRKVISDKAEQLFDRVPGQGSTELREAISGYLARSRSIYVDAGQIVIGAGSEYLYGLLVQLFGRETLFGIEDPSYSKIEKVYRAQGARLEMLRLGDDGIASAALNTSKAQVLHISPYRSFPSGISTTASKRREYIRWADSRGAYIIEDDFESEFTPSSKAEETVYSLADRDNVLYLNSFSQTISPSLRISYLILPKALAGTFTEKLGFYACTVPAYEQYVLAEFMNSGEFERHLNRVRRKKRTP